MATIVLILVYCMSKDVIVVKRCMLPVFSDRSVSAFRGSALELIYISNGGGGSCGTTALLLDNKSALRLGR